MTPLDAWLIATGVVTFFIGGAWLLEDTARGRRLADRAIARIERSR